MTSPAASSVGSSQAMRTFWKASSIATSAQDVIAKHASAGQADRTTRWNARRDWRNNGLVSNLFPVKIDPSRIIFRYELEVTRTYRPRVAPPHLSQQQQQGGDQQQQQDQQQFPPPGAAVHHPPVPVSPTRAWRCYAQGLRKIANLPPVLRVGGSIFAAGPLPEEALSLSSQFFDVDWEKATLRLADHAPLSRLSPSDLKQVMNKMLPWALSYHAREDGHFSVVREVDGKMISTEDSLAVAGLRIFRGTTATMLQISNPATTFADSNGADGSGLILPKNHQSSSAATSTTKVPSSAVLSTLNSESDTSSASAPLRVLVVACIRKFGYRDRQISVFQVQDASGVRSFTLWDFDSQTSDTTLTPGSVIDISNFGMKATDPRYRRDADSAEFELQGTAQTIFRKVPDEELMSNNNNNENNNSSNTEDQVIDMDAANTNNNKQGIININEPIAPRFHDATTLALRLDTRCTVASEKSLLDEIKHHFGEAWPYDEEQKKRITRAVQGTPAILSTNLRHTIVRSIRFDFTPEDAPMDPHLRRLAPELHKCQPYAIVHDFSVVPLQVLHCCFDPKMRSWQQVTAPACSFFPQDRVQVLGKFRAALADGLQRWGVTLLEEAFSSRDVTVLEKPDNKPKSRMIGSNLNNNPAAAMNRQQQYQQMQQDKPRLVSICAIRGKHTSTEDLQANEKTCVSLARHFATGHHAVVDGEAAALQHVRRTLCVETPNNNNGVSSLRDSNSVAIFLSSDRDSRAARWLTAECMRRGIMPYFMSGVSNDKRLRLLNVQTSKNLQLKFSSNPFPNSLDLYQEVPSMQGRNVLLVGIDTCHTNATTTGSCVGFVISPGKNFCVPTFWQNEIRGQELEQVTRHFGVVVEEARRKAPNEVLHEIVVFQDGNVYAELEEMEKCVPAGARLSFVCLHKRTHIRFTYNDRPNNRHINVLKGSVVRALTPVNTQNSNNNNNAVVPEFSDAEILNQQQQGNDTTASNENAIRPIPGGSQHPSSFFMQCHECFTSTARTVQFVVHRQSDTLPLPDLQKLTFSLAHVGTIQSTKLPLPTRAAHRLSAQIERLVDASPAFRNVTIPEPLRNRCWFL